MKDLSNIDTSAFCYGEYIGYSGTLVWRISRSNSTRGKWFARNNSNNIYLAAKFLEAWTLSQMNDLLCSFEAQEVSHGV